MSLFETHILDVYRNNPVTNDEYGQPVQNYTLLRTIYGRLVALNGKEIMKDGVSVISNHKLFTMTADLTEADQIKFQGETFNILFVKPCVGQSAIHHYELDLLKVS